MTTKHTPGPWHQGNIRKCNIVAGGMQIATTNEDRGMTAEEKFANAQLIATAPEMYEALLAMTCCITDFANLVAGGDVIITPKLERLAADMIAVGNMSAKVLKRASAPTGKGIKHA